MIPPVSFGHGLPGYFVAVDTERAAREWRIALRSSGPAGRSRADADDTRPMTGARRRYASLWLRGRRFHGWPEAGEPAIA